jgi:dolichyl-diphosphooligosaccharide--protein glycosyltransferase
LGGIYSLLSKNISTNIFLAILLSIWMSGTIYMSLNGVRFILLLAPAFAIAFAVGLYYLMKIINNFISKEFTIKNDFLKKFIGSIIILFIFLALYVPVFNQANTISKGTIPNFDDEWFNSMYKIKNETKQNAIITSWWDFGHFFAAISDRSVTFDGGTQTTPAAHWVGKLLMEENESISVDILRMLVCGNNMAFDKFYEFVGKSNADAVKINKILYQTFGKSKEETINILRNNKYYNLSENQVEEIMNYLKCDNPPESLLITSGDMIGKAGVWAHWGSWDFTKKYVYDNYKSLDVETIAKNIDENSSLIGNYIRELKEIDLNAETQNLKRKDLINRWFADYPSYVPIQGRYIFDCVSQNKSLICENTLKINLETKEVTSQFNGGVKFNKLYYPSLNNTINSLDLDGGDLDIVLLPSAKGYSVMLVQKPLGNSLFTKLFFMNGFGTNNFIKFDDRQGATGNRIIVWKTNFTE